MEIIYTSKRRHKPDVVGAELAPSMTYTNWSAGNSASLSNDAAGNLKVTYNAVSSPYAFKTLTVVSGTTYRVRVTSIADGTAESTYIRLGTTAGGFELGTYDGRHVTTTDTGYEWETYVRASGTSLTISLVSAVSSAGKYGLFNSVSIQPVTTLSHDLIEVCRDDAIVATAFTASNSTLAATNVSASNNPDDNAISITNTGAAYGEARRTYAFPTIAGRKYTASMWWNPGSVSVATLRCGTTAVSADLGYTQLANNLDGSNPFFTAGSGLRWNFTNTDDGWVSTNITPTNNATYISLVSTTSDPQFAKSGLSFSGATNRYVATRITRKAGAWVNELYLYYATAGHSYTPSYYATAAVATLVVDEATIVVWDMWQLIAGGTDWKDSIINSLRIDYTNASGVTWQVDWIAVGNLNPLELTFTATGDYAYLSFYNSGESNAISYYVLPHVDQIDSEYTLTTAAVAAAPEYPSTKNVAVSLSGNVETLFHREDEFWTITTKALTSKAELEDWLEFAASCKGGESFTLDIYDDGDIKTCTIDGDPTVERIEGHKYRMTFRARVLD